MSCASKFKFIHRVRLSSWLGLLLPMLCSTWGYAESSDYLPTISGFGSVGMGISDNSEPYLRELEVTNRLSVAGFNKVGIQLNGWLPKGNSYMMQFLGKNSNEHFDIKLDWMLVAREVTPELTIRAGLLRLPLYLYSKSIEVGKTYPWILPPESVYGTTELTNYHGVDLIYRKSFESISIELQPLIGETKDEFAIPSLPELTLQVDTNRNFGFTGRLFGPDFTLHGSYIRMDSEGQFVIYSNELNSLAEGSSIDGTYEFFSLGISVQVANWMVVAESSHRAASNLSSIQSIDGYYIMLGHRFHTVLLHSTYSVWADDQPEFIFVSGRDHKEVIVGINYDIDSHQTLKIQLHYGDPKNGSMANYRRLSPDIDDVYAFMISYNWVL